MLSVHKHASVICTRAVHEGHRTLFEGPATNSRSEQMHTCGTAVNEHTHAGVHGRTQTARVEKDGAGVPVIKRVRKSGALAQWCSVDRHAHDFCHQLRPVGELSAAPNGPPAIHSWPEFLREASRTSKGPGC